MTVRITKSASMMRAVEEVFEGDTLPKEGDIIPLSSASFGGHFRIDKVELPRTGDNPHKLFPLLYVHSMRQEY